MPRPLAFRSLERPGDDAPAGPHARDRSLAQLEAILLMADEPLTARRLAELLALRDAAHARELVGRLQALYIADESAFQLETIAGGYQLLTRPAVHPWLLRLRRTGHDYRLTPGVMETLAVIAYRQPVMRAELERIRGVACGEIVRVLMEKGLIRLMGRDRSLGRPQLYGTTRKFLQAFGLNSLKDLPEVEALARPKQAPPLPDMDHKDV